MIDSEFHVEINGVRYRLAEDGEGEHYVQQEVPLRAPNTQLVQGVSGEFNVRSDLLLWSWSDWSEGEGQVVYDPNAPGRALILENVDPFRFPGQLRLGHKTFLAKDSGAATFSMATATGRFAKVREELWLQDVGHLYRWDDTNDDRFLAQQSVGGGYFNAGDWTYEYFVSYGVSDLFYRMSTASYTTTLINDQFSGSGSYKSGPMVILGDYAYIYDIEGTTARVWEILKNTINTTTAETPIYISEDLWRKNGAAATYNNGTAMVAAENRVYVMSALDHKTTIHEIVPSSAAGTGYGRIFATLNGLRGEGMWWQGGFLYLLVSTGPQDAPLDRQVIYIDPNGAYGTLGTVRGAEEGTAIPAAAVWPREASTFTNSAFALPGTWSGRTEAQAKLSLFEVDAVTGGIAQTAFFGTVLPNSEGYNHEDMTYYKGKYFLTIEPKSSSATQYVAVADTEVPSDDDGLAISPLVNFGLAGEKLLEQIEVRCQPLPTGSSIEVFYQLDSDGSWTSAGTVAAASSGGTFSIDNTPTQVTFRSLQIKVELNSPADGNQVVLDEVNVYASSNQYTRQWTLLLDATDETSPRGHSGAKLLENLLAIGQNDPVTFKDGYTDRTAGVTTDVDVLVSDAAYALDRPGEGLVRVVLREVL